MRILLVDDDAFLREMYATKFTEADFEVTVASNAKEALDLVESEDAFDVVLTDLVMPGMTGFELLEALQATTKGQNVLKIILSNQGEESDRAKAESIGIDGYIIKAESIPSEVVQKTQALLQT